MYYTLLHLARLETTCGWSSRINIIKLINADEIVPPPKPPKVGMSPASWIRCHTHVEGVPWWSCEHLPDLGTSWWKEQNAEQKLKDKKRPEDAHIYIPEGPGVLRWRQVGWGGVGWGYQRPDDHVLHTTLSAYMLAWGCNMSLRWHFVGVGWGGVGISTSWRPRPWYYVVSIYARLRMQHVTTLTLRWGGVGWGGDINVLTTTSLILRCQHICSLEDATCHYVDTSLGWGGVGISTSWRPRPWYYVVSIYARLRMQHVTTLTLRWGGVGWGGDINVLTTTSLILRCQHICSLGDATCHYDTLAPWVFINKLFICIYLYIHIRIYRDICLYVHMYFYCNMFIHRWNDTNVLRSRDIYMGINIFIHMVIHDIYVLW